MTTSDLTAMLADREKTHGAFSDHARITQRLKNVIAEELVERHERGQPPLTDMQRESLDMIEHKVGRIIAGNPNEPDHWNDIAGYAVLPTKEMPNG